MATWPAIRHADRAFLAEGAPGYGEVAPGDHLQTAYRLWLAGHQLENGRAPWRDPYTFRPEAGPQINLQGWPFGLPYWPLAAAFDAARAWNIFILLTYVAAGGLACAWLRALGLPRGAALVGGAVFAVAPYRVAQSTGHLLGPISVLLPAALLGLERARGGRRGWLVAAAAALASIPLSGQVHLALGALALFLGYAAVRARERTLLAGAAVAAAAAAAVGLVVERMVIQESVVAGGRSLGAVRFYSASWLDFVSRDADRGLERFVFLGWITPVAAVVGLGLLLRARRFWLAGLLGLAALLPILLSLGTNLPLYESLWRSFSPFRYARVPERLMPVACLALAALVAFAVEKLRWRLAPLVVGALLLADLHVDVVKASADDPANAAYASLRGALPGRLLELPVFLPDRHYGSVYHRYAMQAPRERPGGYSTLAPPAADALARRLRPLNCGDWGSGREALLRRLEVRHVAFHQGLYAGNPLVPRRCANVARRALVRHGFRLLARDGAVTLYVRSDV